MQQKRLTKRARRNLQKITDSVEYEQKMYLKNFAPITDRQDDMAMAWHDGFLCIAAIGSAGTGKTYTAAALALTDTIEKMQHDKVIFVRTSVQSRDQGFMPGTVQEKMSYFEGPYIDIVNDLFDDKSAWSTLKKQGKVEFMSTSFIRGLTINNAVIIFDECQSATAHELRSVITRVGQNTRIIFCGDTKQDDLVTSKNRKDVSGLVEFLRVLQKMNSTSMVQFNTDDIVRSGLVREFILAEEGVDYE